MLKLSLRFQNPPKDNVPTPSSSALIVSNSNGQSTPSAQAQPSIEVPPQIISKAASFDCAKAKTPLEIIICADTELSSLDGMVGEAYLKEKNSAPKRSDVRKRV